MKFGKAKRNIYADPLSLTSQNIMLFRVAAKTNRPQITLGFPVMAAGLFVLALEIKEYK